MRNSHGLIYINRCLLRETGPGLNSLPDLLIGSTQDGTGNSQARRHHPFGLGRNGVWYAGAGSWLWASV